MGAAEVNLYFLLRPLELHISNPINNNTIYFNCQVQLTAGIKARPPVEVEDLPSVKFVCSFEKSGKPVK